MVPHEIRLADPRAVALAGGGLPAHRPAHRAGLRRRAPGLQRRLADRALFHRRERLQRLADVRRGAGDEDQPHPHRLRRGADAVPPSGAARRAAGAARQSQQAAASMSASARARSTTSTSSSATACAATTAASAWRRRSRSSSAPGARRRSRYDGKFHKVHVPALRPKPVQQPGPPLWRSVISPGSFTECGKLGVPILTARLPVARIKERWATLRRRARRGRPRRRDHGRGCWRRARCGATSMWPSPTPRPRTSWRRC